MIEGLIASLSYAGVLLALLLASLGVPIPEEVAIVTAGVLSHERVMRWWLALPTCMLGVLAGDVVLYWAGRHFGGRVLQQPLLRRLVDPARLEQTSAAYRRRGALIVVLARNVVGLRAVAFVAAGVVGLPFWKYLVADVLAVSVGVPLNFAIAYFFTAHLHAILAEIHRVERWLALGALGAGAIALYVALRRRSQRAFAIAAAPEPR
jgi:membrane protein DedA with SNARE-associated domain